MFVMCAQSHWWCMLLFPALLRRLPVGMRTNNMNMNVLVHRSFRKFRLGGGGMSYDDCGNIVTWQVL